MMKTTKVKKFHENYEQGCARVVRGAGRGGGGARTDDNVEG